MYLKILLGPLLEDALNVYQLGRVGVLTMYSLPIRLCLAL